MVLRITESWGARVVRDRALRVYELGGLWLGVFLFSILEFLWCTVLGLGVLGFSWVRSQISGSCVISV